MAAQTIYVCDVCDAQKGTGNGWFRLRLTKAFHLYPWNFLGEGADEPNGTSHVCGEACAIRKLGEFMRTLQKST